MNITNRKKLYRQILSLFLILFLIQLLRPLNLISIHIFNHWEEQLRNHHNKLRNQIQDKLDEQYLSQPSPEYICKSNTASVHVFCIIFKEDLDYIRDIHAGLSKDKNVVWAIDNATDSSYSEKLKQVCQQEEINYVRLPSNPYSGPYPLGRGLRYFHRKLIRKKHIGSGSHGIALNWVCRNLIDQNHIQYFGFIDGDIIPTEEPDLVRKLDNQPFYGRKQHVNGVNYLWPGYCFFNRKYVDPKELNFLSGFGADTGSMNTAGIFKKYNLDNFSDVTYQRVQISNGDDLQDHYVEYIDGWLHLINSTNWKSSEGHEAKTQLIARIKNQLLKKNKNL